MLGLKLIHISNRDPDVQLMTHGHLSLRPSCDSIVETVSVANIHFAYMVDQQMVLTLSINIRVNYNFVKDVNLSKYGNDLTDRQLFMWKQILNTWGPFGNMFQLYSQAIKVRYGCLSWVKNWVEVQPFKVLYCVQYRIIFDRDISKVQSMMKINRISLNISSNNHVKSLITEI